MNGYESNERQTVSVCGRCESYLLPFNMRRRSSRPMLCAQLAARDQSIGGAEISLCMFV